MHCRHALSPLDLIPFASFVFLMGRCRYCGKRISWQYPLIELTTALTFLLLVQNFQFPISNFQFWIQIIFACFLTVIAVYDFKHYLILDKVVYPAIIIALVWSVVSGQLVSSLIGVLLIAGFFALQYLISKGRWIGFGDVKLGAFLGLVFGFKFGLIMLMLAYFFGAVAGLALIGLGDKKLNSKMPFGTFLCGSAIITLIFGERIINWYLQLLGL